MLSDGDRRELDHLLDDTRDLLHEAASIVDGSIGPGSQRDRSVETILSLYEELRARLDQVDDDRVATLLARISTNVARLGRLRAEVERIRTLRERVADL